MSFITKENCHRTDSLKCVSIGSVWEALKVLANKNKVSVSAWIRQKALAELKKEKKKELPRAG